MDTIKYILSHENRFSATSLYRGALALGQKLFEPVTYIKNIRRGNRISRIFRHIFERNLVKPIIASNVGLLVLASSFLPVSSATVEFDVAEERVITQQIAQIKTEHSIQFPTDNQYVNQYYGWFHPGIDFEGDTGDSIKPVMPGVVMDVQYSRIGYGNAVIIQNGDAMTSLYAHLSKIMVEPDQKVSLDTIVGEVGSTGRSTGDHLHLEIRSGTTPVNPLSILQ
jgi:murein DD-endopeptidase MepM/ murein hydrolase activator NlpD